MSYLLEGYIYIGSAIDIDFGKSTDEAKVSQGFKLRSSCNATVASVKAHIVKDGSPTNSIYVSIWSDNGSGDPFAELGISDSVSGASIPASGDTETEFTFSSPVYLVDNTQYHLVYKASSLDASNYYELKHHNVNNIYGDEDYDYVNRVREDNTIYATETAWDAPFKIFGNWENPGIVVVEANYGTGYDWGYYEFGRNTTRYKSAQGFKLRGGTFGNVHFAKAIIQIVGSPVSGVFVEIMGSDGTNPDPDNILGTSETLSHENFDLNPDFNWSTFNFPGPITLQDETLYWFVLGATSLSEDNHYKPRNNSKYGEGSYEKQGYLTQAGTFSSTIYDTIFQLYGEWEPEQIVGDGAITFPLPAIEGFGGATANLNIGAEVEGTTGADGTVTFPSMKFSGAGHREPFAELAFSNPVLNGHDGAHANLQFPNATGDGELDQHPYGIVEFPSPILESHGGATAEFAFPSLQLSGIAQKPAIAELTFPAPTLYGTTNVRIGAGINFPSPAIEGTVGAIAGHLFPEPQLSATGKAGVVSSAALEFIVPVLEAVGGATAEYEFPSIALEAAGKAGVISNADLRFPNPTVSAHAYIGQVGIGNLLFPNAQLSATGIQGIVSNANLIFSKMRLSAYGYCGEMGELDLLFPIPQLNATGYQNPQSAGSLIFPVPDLGGIVRQADRFDGLILQHERWPTY